MIKVYSRFIVGLFIGTLSKPFSWTLTTIGGENVLQSDLVVVIVNGVIPGAIAPGSSEIGIQNELRIGPDNI